MNAVFALDNRASAEDVRARLTNPPGYSAVRALVVSRRRVSRVLWRFARSDGDLVAHPGIVDGRGARRAAVGDRARAQRKAVVMAELSLLMKVTVVLVLA